MSENNNKAELKRGDAALRPVVFYFPQANLVAKGWETAQEPEAEPEKEHQDVLSDRQGKTGEGAL